MKFNFERFIQFSKRVKISSKEQGLRSLYPLLGTQDYLFQEIIKGLEDDVHHFVIDKGRQQGVTTGCLVLDLFWLFTHPGIHGNLITDDESNREQARANLASYMASLPDEYSIPVVTHNRSQLVLENDSRMHFTIAGKSKKGGLGRGKGVALVHGTELSSWADEQGLVALIASLAEHNPSRLYLFESTPYGYNTFYDMCQAAKRAVTQRFIFVGWWRNQFYRCEKGSKAYEVYWDGKLSKVEREWVREIKVQYGFEIQSEQLAWWRLQFYEKYHEDEMALMQEHPPTEERGFVLTGSRWFNSKVLTEAFKTAKTLEYRALTYHFGEQFTDTIVWDSTPQRAELKVWEEPVEGASYIVACDPAYGGSTNADNFVVVVVRAYADGIDDVAEYCTPEIDTYKCAWVICHLAGYYSQGARGSSITLQIEANGPGRSVIDEIKNLRRQATTYRGAELGEVGKDIKAAVRCMSWYLFRRPDSLGPPTQFVGTAFENNPDMKHRMMSTLRDIIHRNLYRVRSTGAIEEMRTIVKEPPPDNDIHAEGTAKDDRVMARGIAAIAWYEQVRPRLEVVQMTRKTAEARAQGHPDTTVIEGMMGNYFKNAALRERLANMRPRPGGRILVK